MRLASWNTRGLGNIEKGRMAGSMVNKYQLQFLAIQETMVKKVKQPILNSIWKHFVFQEVQVSSNGRSGGLLSIWRDACFTLLNHWSNRFWIATLLRYTPNQRIILIINVYAPQSEHDKLFVWNQLSAIANQWSGPICLFGDFNSVCHQEERFREVIDPLAVSNFNNFIISANVFDQALCNEKFTWEGPDGKMSRIDRVMVNVSWLSLFPDSILKAAQQAALIEAQFDHVEIYKVICGFDGNKTPGPDGFSLSFFKKGWCFLEDELLLMFSEFHTFASFPKGFNSSFLVLIPKTNSSKLIDQMHPISLINAPYKIIAKVLANRLKKVISNIISDNQHGFVPSRSLLDGVMLVNEVVHLAKKRKSPILLLKLDFTKAYDSISHEFLFEVLNRLGFGSRFISWIKCCISDINFSVLLNGSPSKEGVMLRGLRQGDPLSSFLFILVAEVLSRLLSNDLKNRVLQGFKVDSNTNVNHSQFADDTILIVFPSTQELNRIKEVLNLFSQVSGLKINQSKSMLYGIHVSRNDLRSYANFFGCDVGSFPLLYLGVPIGVASRRIAMWDPIILKFKRRLAGWKGRCLSFGGRLVMVKAVLSSLPLHYMALYKAPKAVIAQLERFRRNFLWGGDCLKSKSGLVKWQVVCTPVDVGGLGITPLLTKNIALLAKWWSKLYDNKLHVWQALVCTSFGKFFSGKIVYNSSSISCTKVSPIWSELLKIYTDGDLVNVVGKNSWKWHLKDGSLISFWNDNWVGNYSLRDQFPSLFRISDAQNAPVSHFRWPSDPLSDQVGWNLHLLAPLTELDSLTSGNRLVRINGLACSVGQDFIRWVPDVNGDFSVSEAIRLLSVSTSSHTIKWRQLVWNNRVPSKVAIFHWLACKQSIPVRDVLIRRHILPLNHSPLCIWCEEKPETSEHLLLHCPWTFKIWSALFQWWNINWVIPSSMLRFSADWYYGMGIGDRKFWRLIGPATIWAIWLARNDFIFNGNYSCWSSIVRQIKIKVFIWATFKFCYSHQSYVWDSNSGLLCRSV
ncbi:uncharacterized protein [Rutidosis leptorrhynchoides]|uniref:uncharacterized protein n=1 Tax=Rutidosis leptorrhynchoides TaxID=125765 RepID=UPI003A9A5DFC